MGFNHKLSQPVWSRFEEKDLSLFDKESEMNYDCIAT